MVISVVVGLSAGIISRSRWTMLLAPSVFAAVFEIVRVGAQGPTVDAMHPTTTYGLMAFVVGRGFHGALSLAPMAIGAVLGAAYARRSLGTTGVRGRLSTIALYGRRTVTVITTVALIALTLLVARPARTAAITGPDGHRLPGSIAELTRVDIGGHSLAVMLRGTNVDNPVMLFLAGGPGGTELGAMRKHAQGLENDFVVATFDQRGTGKSHDQLEPTSTLTLDNAVRDVVEVTNYLRDRFGEDRIYLVGQSWGTILGVRAVQQQPSLFHAFVGTGQMVSVRETDRIFYADTLSWARQRGDQGLVDKLTAIGPPPYQNILDYETALSHEHEVYPYDHTTNSEGEDGFSENLFVGEYTLVEQIHNLGAFLDVFSVMYPQLQDIDFRVDVTSLDVSVYLVQGRHEAGGRAELATEWFNMLDAPHKELVVLDSSGHRPIFEQPEEFRAVMTDTVLAQTANKEPS